MATKKSKKKSAAGGGGKKKKPAKRKTAPVKGSAAKKPAAKKPAAKKPAAKKSAAKKSAAKKKTPAKKQAAVTGKAAAQKKPGTRKQARPKPKAASVAEQALSGNAALHAEASSSSLFKRLKNGLKTIKIAGQKLWIAEGDTLLDESELMIYARQREKANEAAQAAGDADTGGLGMLPLAGGRGLVANTSNGKITKWPPGTTLSYRIVLDTFDRKSRYDTIVTNMKQAANEWQQTCGIRFEHKQNLDAKPGKGPGGATFAVQVDDSGGDWLALAFFPNAPEARRLLLISPSYFRKTSYDKVGILRHELGHILGFRHEQMHSGASANCPKDADLFNKEDLTKYDPKSVMHYFCEGASGTVGSKELAISETDRQGAQMVYGPPLSGSSFV